MSVNVNPRKAGNITEYELIGSWVVKKKVELVQTH